MNQAPTIDVGEQSLHALKNARHYNKWLVDQFKCFLGRGVMELGAGIGNMAQHLLDHDLLLLVEQNEKYLEILKHRFRSNAKVSIIPGDLEDSSTFEKFSSHDVNSLICLNVMEHLVDDVGFLKQLQRQTRQEQNIVIAVPQHSWLYSRFDELVEHQRRYSKKELYEKLEESGFEIQYLKDFNRIGCLGWFLRFRLLKSTSISRTSTWLFDKGVPIWKFFEYLKLIPALSLIAVVRPRSSLGHVRKL